MCVVFRSSLSSFYPFLSNPLWSDCLWILPLHATFQNIHLMLEAWLDCRLVVMFVPREDLVSCNPIHSDVWRFHTQTWLQSLSVWCFPGEREDRRSLHRNLAKQASLICIVLFTIHTVSKQLSRKSRWSCLWYLYLHTLKQIELDGNIVTLCYDINYLTVGICCRPSVWRGWML